MRAPLLVLALTLGGCGATEYCTDGPSTFAVLTGAAAADDGTAVVAISRQRADEGGCKVLGRSGTLYVIEPGSDHVREVRLPGQSGAVAVRDRTALVLEGNWGSGIFGIDGPGASATLFEVDLDTFEIESRTLPGGAAELVPIAGDVAIPVPGVGVVLATGTAPMNDVTTLAQGGGRLWAADGSEIVEVDPATAQEISRADACPTNAFARVADSLLVGCTSSGIGTFEIATGTFAVVDTAQRAMAIRGSPASAAAIVALGPTDSEAYPSVFVLGSGFLASVTPPNAGLRDALFIGGRIFVTTMYGHLSVVQPDFTTQNPFPYWTDVMRIVESDGVLAAGYDASIEDHDGIGWNVLWFDPQTYAVTRGPIGLDSDSAGSGSCALASGTPLPVAALFLLLVASFRRLR